MSCEQDRGPWRDVHGPACRYDRRRDLPRLAAVWPREIDDDTPTGRQRIIALLEAMLRAERQRGEARHWTYDVARHRGLMVAYRCELALLRSCSDDEEQPPTCACRGPSA
jgi:hypothetical protein